MKTLRDYITETEAWIDEPATGDDFAINLREECLIETYIVDTTEDGVVLQADERMMSLLEQYGLIGERIGRHGAVGNNAGMGYSIGEDMSALAHQDEIENDLIGEGDIDPNRHPQTRDYGRGEDQDDLPFEPNQDISHKDQFGNPIKHRARHLARKGLSGQSQDVKEQGVAEGSEDYQEIFQLNSFKHGKVGAVVQYNDGKFGFIYGNKLSPAKFDRAREAEQALNAQHKKQGVAEGMLDNIKQAWARLIAGLADKAIALDRTGELAGSQQRAIQHSTRELEQKLLAKIAGHPREDELRRQVDYIVAQAGQQTNFSDLAKTLHKMIDQFKPEMEKFSEGAMKELDIELQDYKSMSPQEFERAYGMKKADWAMKHHDIISKHNLQVDWTGKTGFDYVRETSAYMARMLELAGVADHKYNKEDVVYHEDQDAAQVAAKELNRDAAQSLGEREDDMNRYESDQEDMEEAKYRGREVKLGKPMAGDVKKSKVYVRGPKGNVVKVNFGDPNMRIKKSNPARRKSFRARHNCDNPGPRHKARFWSCRAW